MRRGVPCAVVSTALLALSKDSFHYASGGPALSCLAPPSFALPVFLPAFPPEALERSVDASRLNWPVPPPTSLVAQIRVPVGCADEDALPWLDHFLAAVTWAIALHLAADEGLEQRRLGTRHCVHL